MKKKILIVIVAVAMMIPLLAVGVSADYSPETGWSEPVGTFEPIYDVPMYYSYDGSTNSFSKSITGSIGAPFEYEGEQIFFKYKLVVYKKPDGNFNTSILYNRENGYCLAVNTRTAEGDYIIGDLIRSYNNIGMSFYDIEDNSLYLYDEPYVFYLTDYPFSGNLDAWANYTFEVYEVAIDVPHPFLALIELMFDNFSRIIGGLAAGVTGAFTALIWENPEATEKSLSTLAKFIFTIAGLSIGMTVFYLVLRLIRFGRQR